MKVFFLFLIFFVFFACSKNDDHDGEKYYQFTEVDEKLIINYDYKVGQTIVYENQFGEQLHFKVISNKREKYSYYKGGTFSGGSTFSHYYESKIIRFEILENSPTATPPRGNSKVNYVFSKNFGEFDIGMNFPMWNIINFSFMDQIQNSVNIYLRDYNDDPKIQIDIKGHLFENIVIIHSDSNDTPETSLFGQLPQNVNEIYYDYDFGIVRFDDLDGKQWEVIYPE